jgi:serine/threonine-protein kinase
MDIIGQRLAGKYEIRSEIGQGGMGVVYEAQDTMLRRRVAVKVLAPHLAGDPAFVRRFQH